MRINIPANPSDFIALSKGVLAKHTALGAASPLNGIPGIAGLSAQITTADTNNIQAVSLAAQAETATQIRDNAIGATASTPGSVRFFMTSARDVLLAVNKGTEHKLGDWGFEVNAPAAPTTPQLPAAPQP